MNKENCIKMRFIEIYIIGKADERDVKLDTCDGCNRKYNEGEKRLDNIDSCCGGGCARNLCIDCIKWAYNQLN